MPDPSGKLRFPHCQLFGILPQDMIYADFNATTPLGEGARSGILKAMEVWGNPSSAHTLGRKATAFLEESRRDVALRAGCKAEEIVFTSGGSESDSSVLLGMAWNYPEPFRILSSPVEHSAILATLEALKGWGAEVGFLPILPTGELDLEQSQTLIREFRPHLVSMMSANNETGVIFPINELADFCHSMDILLHTDAVQAFGKLDSTHWQKADFISISAHKIYGPKGVGALIVRNKLQLARTHFGGSQEIKRRGGTQNMLGIGGFAGACKEWISDEKQAEIERLRNRFEQKLNENIEDLVIHGLEAKRTLNTTNFRVPGISAQVLLSALDLDGICVSSGSACSSGSVNPSHVLLALGLDEKAASEGLRISWGKCTTEQDIDTTATAVIEHVKRIRARRKS